MKQKLVTNNQEKTQLIDTVSQMIQTYLLELAKTLKV